MTDCVFCQIVDGSAPARKVYEDDAVVGFLDIKPVSRGHTLIVPRTHSAGLADLAPDDGAALMRAGQVVAAALRTTPLTRDDSPADGVNLVVNDGKAAFQTVFHTHLHVIPRERGDKLRMARSLLVRRDKTPDVTAATVRAAVLEQIGRA
ncbi:HIT family protein [Gordonia sputi]|uniref:HIT family protein n=1 Tax=Gordonia sputi TaxID=36823 RepID=UPI00226E4E12|nr:HIT family protein [Gordonia sputi]